MVDVLSIKVIAGSTRQNRFSEKPAHWIFDALQKREGVKAELLDLRDYPMPFYDDARSPSMIKDGSYSDDTVKKWAAKIREADGFIIVTPEYNHGYSPVLKNALDSVYYEWNNKAVGFVSWGSAMGARSVEQLRQVAVELQMASIRNAIHLPWDYVAKLGPEKTPVNPDMFGPMNDKIPGFLDQLVWWTIALKAARESKAD